MDRRPRAWWVDVSQSLGFIPGLIVVAFGILGIVLVEVDESLDLEGVEVVFKGDAPAARTVLSVIAGSLITVAGLTFSITMVVLQLASSQFTPRILRTFFGDRITQITIGTYVGTFVYSILVLRAVGSFGDDGFVPRLSTTFASLFGIAAVLLLVVFLHHVSRMIQVSHAMAGIAEDALARIDKLYPERYGEPVAETTGAEVLAGWHEEAEPGGVRSRRPGFVRRIELEALAEDLPREVERLALHVCPGDFVGLDTTLAEVWPAELAERCAGRVREAVALGAERDLDQDVDFGLRQLADTALRALSPGVNDPMTAVTCIRYMASILVRLAERAEPPDVRRFPDRELTVVARRRSYAEHLEGLLQISRYVEGDEWVARELQHALEAAERAAVAAGAGGRAREVERVSGLVEMRAR